MSCGAPIIGQAGCHSQRAAEALHPLSRQAGSPLRSLEVFGSLWGNPRLMVAPPSCQVTRKAHTDTRSSQPGLQLGHYEAWKLDGADWQMELERTGVLRDMMGLLYRQKMIEHVETEQKNLKNGCTLICRAGLSTAHWHEPPCFITLLGKISIIRFQSSHRVGRILLILPPLEIHPPSCPRLGRRDPLHVTLLHHELSLSHGKNVMGFRSWMFPQSALNQCILISKSGIR